MTADSAGTHSAATTSVCCIVNQCAAPVLCMLLLLVVTTSQEMAERFSLDVAGACDSISKSPEAQRPQVILGLSTGFCGSTDCRVLLVFLGSSAVGNRC